MPAAHIHKPSHPAFVAVAEKRAADSQLRIADAITKFAGSMGFVYIHIVAFAVWMLVVEKSPWPTLTLVVSLEAIFLSTFVMIGQNRQAAFQQAKADHDFTMSEKELHLNTELTEAIHNMITAVHAKICVEPAAAATKPCQLTGAVLFVCSGNICRSPTAEAVMRHLVDEAGLSDEIEVDGAGTGAWHVGDPPDERATARPQRGAASC